MSSTQLNEKLFQRNHKLLGYLIPSRFDLDGVTGSLKGIHKGAELMCKPGVYANVKVYDFKSLYVSNLCARNLSYETLRGLVLNV